MPGYTREIRVELQPYTNHCAPFSYTQGYGRIGHPKLLAYHGLPTRYNLDDIQLYRGAHHSVLPTGLHLFSRGPQTRGFLWKQLVHPLPLLTKSWRMLRGDVVPNPEWLY